MLQLIKLNLASFIAYLDTAFNQNLFSILYLQKKGLKLYLSILVFGLYSSFLHGQIGDSTKTIEIAPVTEHFPEKGFYPYKIEYSAVDTSLNGVQKYFPNNFPYSMGLVSRELIFKPSSTFGFQSGFSNLDLFGHNRKEQKYYRARTPFTEIYALFGMKKEQYF